MEKKKKKGGRKGRMGEEETYPARREVQEERLRLRQLANIGSITPPCKAARIPNDIKDLGAIWEKIRESKRQVLKYYTSGAEQVNLLTSGSVAVSDAWFVPIYNLIKQGKPFGFWPSTGSYIQFGSMVALKGSPLDALYEMIDILLRPEVSFALALANRQSAAARSHEARLPEGRSGHSRL